MEWTLKGETAKGTRELSLGSQWNIHLRKAVWVLNVASPQKGTSHLYRMLNYEVWEGGRRPRLAIKDPKHISNLSHTTSLHTYPGKSGYWDFPVIKNWGREADAFNLLILLLSCYACYNLGSYK